MSADPLVTQSNMEPYVESEERDVEVLMEGGGWEPARLLQDGITVHGHAALITHNGVTAWLYRNQGTGRPNEWREVS